MNNQIILNPFKSYLKSRFIYLAKLSLISKRHTNQSASTNSGFTLLEMITVVLMIGILAAIAIPSWLTFLNRQRLNTARDAIISAIQDAQEKAKNSKQSYMVSFQTNSSNIIQTAVYPAIAVTSGVIPANYWQELDGGNLQIPPGAIILGSNISGINTSGSVVYGQAYSSSSPNQTIMFDNLGTLSTVVSMPSQGFEIVVALPGNNSTTPSSTKRCVMIETLLGSIVTNKDSSCN